MKVTVQFELNLAGTRFNIADDDQVKESLHNLCIFLDSIRLSCLERACDAEATFEMNIARTKQNQRNIQLAMARLRSISEDLNLAEQITANLQVEGKPDNGRKFRYSSKRGLYRHVPTQTKPSTAQHAHRS